MIINNGSTTSQAGQYYSPSSNTYGIFRDYLSYNTTSIPNNATITSAKLNIKTGAKTAVVYFDCEV